MTESRPALAAVSGIVLGMGFFLGGNGGGTTGAFAAGVDFCGGGGGEAGCFAVCGADTGGCDGDTSFAVCGVCFSLDGTVEVAGMTKICLQDGHAPFFPARLSFTFNFLPQYGHAVIMPDSS